MRRARDRIEQDILGSAGYRRPFKEREYDQAKELQYQLCPYVSSSPGSTGMGVIGDVARSGWDALTCPASRYVANSFDRKVSSGTNRQLTVHLYMN